VELIEKTAFRVRFNETDPLGIVWHGNYIHYFEDGREAFGRKYGLGYMDIYDQGFVAPIVNVNCNYKKSLRYTDQGIVETTFVNQAAAKMHFRYRIFMAGSEELVAEGSSMQVFLDRNDMQLQLSSPDFFEAWKCKQGL
jgi:acyl-CoA thioester hydrolase